MTPQDEREAAISFMRHDGLCAVVGGYDGYGCTCGMEAARDALRQPGAEYRRAQPSGETLEHYGERIAAKVRRVMMDRLDDDVIGCLGQSHIIFGKACAMEAVTTAMDEVRLLPARATLEGHQP